MIGINEKVNFFPLFFRFFKFFINFKFLKFFLNFFIVKL